MSNETDTRDEYLRDAITKIEIPPLSPDFFARTSELALAGDALVPNDRTRSRPGRWKMIVAAVAAVIAAAVAGGFIGAGVTHAPVAARASSPVLAFDPAADWNSVVAPLPSKLQANNEIAWASNVPFKGEDLASGWPNETVKTLPADGVVVFASLAHSVDDPSNYPDRAAPLHLSDGYFLSSHYEGQPAPNVSLQMIYARVNGQFILVQVWFGQPEPSTDQKQAAEQELARLAVPAA